STGPSTMEIKLRGDVDRLRRELARLKKGDAAPAPESEAPDTRIAELTDTRRRLARLYFAQVEADRRRAARVERLCECLAGIQDAAPDAMPQRLAEVVHDVLGFGAAMVLVRDEGTDRLVVRGAAGRMAAGTE